MKNGIIFFKIFMKKTNALILLLTSIFSLVLSSCNDASFSASPINSGSSSNNKSNIDQYSLTIIGSKDLIHDQPHLLGESSKTSFNAGDVVYFSTAVIMDASIIFKLNDDKMEEANPHLDDGNSSYTPHSFVMPAQDSILKVSVVNGFLSLHALPLGKIYDWIYYLEDDDIVSATSIKSAIGNPSFNKFNEHYTANKEELTNLYSYLKNKTVEATDYPITPGSQTISISLTTKANKTYTITAHDNRLNGNALAESYLLNEPLPEFSTLNGYSFDSNSLMNLKVTNLLNGEDATSNFTPRCLNDMVFKPLEGVGLGAVMNEYNKYKFETICGYFIFQSEKVLSISDNESGSYLNYQIVSDFSFSSILKTQEGS